MGENEVRIRLSDDHCQYDFTQLMQNIMKIVGKSLQTGEIFHLERKSVSFNMKLLTSLPKK